MPLDIHDRGHTDRRCAELRGAREAEVPAGDSADEGHAEETHDGEHQDDQRLHAQEVGGAQHERADRAASPRHQGLGNGHAHR